VFIQVLPMEGYERVWCVDAIIFTIFVVLSKRSDLVRMYTISMLELRMHLYPGKIFNLDEVRVTIVVIQSPDLVAIVI
jgi:hypothetical protein